jgi:hypothetical protein
MWLSFTRHNDLVLKSHCSRQQGRLNLAVTIQSPRDSVLKIRHCPRRDYKYRDISIEENAKHPVENTILHPQQFWGVSSDREC